MNITIKDVPEELHSELRHRADSHGRSLNKEVLAILESMLKPVRVSPRDLLTRIEERRDRLPKIVKRSQLERIINEGR
ncbi:MAG: Arc family DNA-binding protein [Verrucomicrobiota bacterium]